MSCFKQLPMFDRLFASELKHHWSFGFTTWQIQSMFGHHMNDNGQNLCRCHHNFLCTLLDSHCQIIHPSDIIGCRSIWSVKTETNSNLLCSFDHTMKYLWHHKPKQDICARISRARSCFWSSDPLGVQAGCHVVSRGRRGALWHSNL